MSEEYKMYFQRKLEETGGYPDTYQYDDLSSKLKIQIYHLFAQNFGLDKRTIINDYDRRLSGFYQKIYNSLVLQLGVLGLVSSEYNKTFSTIIFDYFFSLNDIDIELSIIELLFRNGLVYKGYAIDNYENASFINELNTFFKQNGTGYQFENGQIIRIDSHYIHAEAVKPTLSVLSQQLYEGAQQEFLRAHEHYRHQRYPEAMVDCLKAYESTIKIIMKKRGWEYEKSDTAKELTGKILQQQLIPKYWTQYFSSLKNTLIAGVPTSRNNEAGHGQGDELKDIPDYLVSYVLHMTASAILFLVKAEESYA